MGYTLYCDRHCRGWGGGWEGIFSVFQTQLFSFERFQVSAAAGENILYATG